MAERRRLPVVQPPSSGGDEEADARPPWHWVGFGAVAIFAAWLPLAYVAQALGARVTAARFGSATQEEVAAALAAMSEGDRARLTATLALPHVMALAIAAFAGGLLVGRFGAGAGAREAASAGAAVALVAMALSYRAILQGGALAVGAALVTTAVAVGFAAWGGRVGARRKGGAASAR